MRILFVHTGSDLYGASRSLLRLASRLVAQGHAVCAVLPFDGPLRAPLAAAGIDVRIDRRMPLLTRRQMRSAFGAARLLLRLPRALLTSARTILEFRPDLVHTNTAAVLPAYGWAARLLGRPHVQHLRESFGDFGRLWKVYERIIASASSRIVAVSDAMAGQFGAAARRKTAVIHNGLPREEFSPVSPARVNEFRQRSGLEAGALVGVVGRIKFQRKGQDVFVRAAALLRAAHPQARFVIVGSAFPGNEDHEARLTQLIAELGMGGLVVLTGDVADVQAAIASLDVVVLPSAQPEPFGGVVLEAMALGRPVVGTRIGGTPEQIEDGVSGLLVPPNDPPALAAAISRLLGQPDLRARMGAEGRARFLQRFEFEDFYKRLLDLYAGVLSRPGRSAP